MCPFPGFGVFLCHRRASDDDREEDLPYKVYIAYI